jgi:hypothetical protein
MSAIEERIRKLLALADSPNEKGAALVEGPARIVKEPGNEGFWGKRRDKPAWSRR